LCQIFNCAAKKEVLQEWPLLTAEGYNAKRKRPLARVKDHLHWRFCCQNALENICKGDSGCALDIKV
jgi:hypothetical protein